MSYQIVCLSCGYHRTWTILGHRDPRMTVRYQHLAPGHLSDAMQSLDRAATAPPESVTEALVDAQ